MVGVDPSYDDAGLPTAEAGAPVDGASPIDATVAADGSGPIDAGFDAGPLCDAPSLTCCGSGPCPAGTTECINGACFASIDVEAKVDGYDDLRLKGDTAQWQHLSFDPPTSLKLNGATWTTAFNGTKVGDNCTGCFGTTTKTLAPPVAAHAQAGILAKFSGRGVVSLSPATADNGFTLVLHFGDPDNSNASYSATVKYETR